MIGIRHFLVLGPVFRVAFSAATTTILAAMASKRSTGEAGGGRSISKGNQSATHVYASSLAIPIQSDLAHLQAKLTSLSQRISPLLQRDVILSRIDDTDPYRMELEANDSSFAPIQRARLQSRLHVRFENEKIEMRVYSQGQGAGASKGSDMVNIRSLIIAEVHSDGGKDQIAYSRRSEDMDATQKRSKNLEILPNEINAGGDHWHQITLAMGWM